MESNPSRLYPYNPTRFTRFHTLNQVTKEKLQLKKVKFQSVFLEGSNPESRCVESLVESGLGAVVFVSSWSPSYSTPYCCKVVLFYEARNPVEPEGINVNTNKQVLYPDGKQETLNLKLDTWKIIRKYYVHNEEKAAEVEIESTNVVSETFHRLRHIHWSRAVIYALVLSTKGEVIRDGVKVLIVWELAVFGTNWYRRQKAITSYILALTDIQLSILQIMRWSMRFEEEEVRAVALGSSWVAAVTSLNFLRIGWFTDSDEDTNDGMNLLSKSESRKKPSLGDKWSMKNSKATPHLLLLDQKCRKLFSQVLLLLSLPTLTVMCSYTMGWMHIDFHDTGRGPKIPAMIDRFGFTMASLNENGSVFANLCNEKSMSTLMYRPFKSWANNSEQRHVVSLDGPIVTASGFGDELTVVTYSYTIIHLDKIYSVFTNITRLSYIFIFYMFTQYGSSSFSS
ncbi:hypothetical protein CTI12_AA478350 [Artemisia annua]|uniref:WDHD1/CFT4 second beta-propeller domain-containing protein n=1 Tax=Artemisia annua TaxID=35608 RepID=A0A2U1LLA6_ARTAN|nr:hypothetical protein CTI12_AA478350 [Artemisia annua]